ARCRRRHLSRSRSRAEIDLHHPGIAGHRALQALRNLLAVIEHHHAIDHPHQDAHDVLDPDDGDAEFVADLAQHVGGLVHLVLVEPAEAFVGEQKLWPRGERFCEFELLQPGGTEAVDAGVSVPDSMLKIVLLPEPFGPIRPRISPCSTRNDTLLTAVKPPKRFTNPSTVSTPDLRVTGC